MWMLRKSLRIVGVALVEDSELKLFETVGRNVAEPKACQIKRGLLFKVEGSERRIRRVNTQGEVSRMDLRLLCFRTLPLAGKISVIGLQTQPQMYRSSLGTDVLVL